MKTIHHKTDLCVVGESGDCVQLHIKDNHQRFVTHSANLKVKK